MAQEPRHSLRVHRAHLPVIPHLCAMITATLLWSILLGGCTKHEERFITTWLKVDIRRPVTGTNGIIVLGSRDEIFHTKIGDRWVRLGAGNASSYIVLDEERAALIDLHDGKGVQLVREDVPPRTVAAVFGRGADLFVVPGGNAIDVFDCHVPATPAGCREAQINRYDSSGALLTSFTVTLPEAYSACQQTRIVGYDKQRIPYVFAQCPMSSMQAKCVVLASRNDGLFVYAVGESQPWKECSELSHTKVTLTSPEQFTVMP